MSGTGVGIWRTHGRSMGLGVADVNAMSSHLGLTHDTTN
jgi:hypothetical protein